MEALHLAIAPSQPRPVPPRSSGTAHPRVRSLHSGCLRATHSTSTPSRSKAFPIRLSVFRVLLLVRTEARSSQQALVNLHAPSLQQTHGEKWPILRGGGGSWWHVSWTFGQGLPLASTYSIQQSSAYDICWLLWGRLCKWLYSSVPLWPRPMAMGLRRSPHSGLRSVHHSCIWAGLGLALVNMTQWGQCFVSTEPTPCIFLIFLNLWDTDCVITKIHGLKP